MSDDKVTPQRPFFSQLENSLRYAQCACTRAFKLLFMCIQSQISTFLLDFLLLVSSSPRVSSNHDGMQSLSFYDFTQASYGHFVGILIKRHDVHS